jgi:peroxin-14
VREDYVENAVKFLSHPKVRGSPVVYRRSFLEKKGLTTQEIDEALRRVPVRRRSILLPSPSSSTHARAFLSYVTPPLCLLSSAWLAGS